MKDRTILLAAGGTGGHLFPAEALANELIGRGYLVHLATDERGERYAANFPAEKRHLVRSATFAGKNPLALARAAMALYSGYRQSARLVREIKPAGAVGFGGYPSVPPIWAASAAGVPCVLHEQNAILGRANRMLAPRVKAIATGFALSGQRPGVPIIETGNPVRPMVSAVRDRPYPSRQPGGRMRLVVFGGSQGARFLSEAMPRALALLDDTARNRLDILQQAREEDVAEVREAYERLGVRAELSPFFANMPAEIAGAHFVIARAGASSVTELAVIGRPSLLVPLPGSLDGDQAANATAMEKAGGGFLVRQSELSPEALAAKLRFAIENPEALAKMAAAARSTGIPDAAAKLADCLEYAISGANFPPAGQSKGSTS